MITQRQIIRMAPHSRTAEVHLRAGTNVADRRMHRLNKTKRFEACAYPGMKAQRCRRT